MFCFKNLPKRPFLSDPSIAFSFSLFDKILPQSSPFRKFIYEFYLICKDGTKETYFDLKYLYSVRKIPESQLNVMDLRRKRLIKHDLVKLIPFTFFLVVPLSEFLLPPYLLFFPNAIPQRYVKFFLETRKKDFLEKKRQLALKELDLPGHWKGLDSERLIQVADLLKMEYFSLTFFISQSLILLLKTPLFLINVLLWMIRSQRRIEFKHWIFEYRIKLNYFPFESLKRRVLLYQIRKYLDNLWKEDRRLLEMEDIKLTELEARQYLEERGVINHEKTDWISEIKEWRDKVKHKKIEDFLTMLWENARRIQAEYAMKKKSH